MDDIIRGAADIIRRFDPACAQAFIDQPFSRVDIAFAFAAGFAKADTDDIHPSASVVIRVAFADRDHRAAGIGS